MNPLLIISSISEQYVQPKTVKIKKSQILTSRIILQSPLTAQCPYLFIFHTMLPNNIKSPDPKNILISRYLYGSARVDKVG